MDRPHLSPQFCFSQTTLRDFLRISRGAIDDTITQHLNALVTPSRAPFDPDSTIASIPRPLSRRSIERNACDQFKSRILFPAWQARIDVLDYCASVATAPDPDDPTHLLRETEDAQARARSIDERLDPYSARYVPRLARTEMLATTIRNERAVEAIVRARSWSLVSDRCDVEASNADEAFDRWQRRQDGRAIDGKR